MCVPGEAGTGEYSILRGAHTVLILTEYFPPSGGTSEENWIDAVSLYPISQPCNDGLPFDSKEEFVKRLLSPLGLLGDEHHLRAIIRMKRRSVSRVFIWLASTNSFPFHAGLLANGLELSCNAPQ